MGQAERCRSDDVRFGHWQEGARLPLQEVQTKLSIAQDGHGGCARFLSRRDGELGFGHLSRVQAVARREIDVRRRETEHRRRHYSRADAHVVREHDHARMVGLSVVERGVCKVFPILCHCSGNCNSFHFNDNGRGISNTVEIQLASDIEKFLLISILKRAIEEFF